MIIKKEITLPLTGFVMMGSCNIELWGGGTGMVNMHPVYFEKFPTKKQMIQKLNDGGMGCVAIITAWVNISAVYGYEYRDCAREYNFTQKQIGMSGKRGI